MQIVKVMVQVSVLCPICGKPRITLSTAPITADGRIGEPDPLTHPIPECVPCANKASAVDRKKDRQRKKWMSGKARLIG